MGTTFDLKQPTVVMVGHWNSAILNEPAWVALNILGVDEGQKIQVQQIVTGNQVGLNPLSQSQQIWFFEDFGISCSPQRLEIFIRDVDNLDPINGLITKLGQLLPHTPVNGIGVNFHYMIEGGIAAITAQFETNETLDGIGTTRDQERSDSIQIPTESLIEYQPNRRPDAMLTFSRNTDFTNVHLDLNYHQDLPGVQFLKVWCDANPIEHWKKHAEDVLRSNYDIDEIDAVYF